MGSKTLLIVAIVLTVISSFQLKADSLSHIDRFESFKQTYAKEYGTETEEAYRMAVYIQNMEYVNEHNAKTGETHTKAENQFSDLTQEEFKSIYLGYKRQTKNSSTESENIHKNELFTLSGNINWAKSGVVSSVKDQGECGSCWTFSAAAATESLKAIKTGSIVNFSEQQILDCCNSRYGTCEESDGCNGGIITEAFNFYAKYGICTASSYPYKDHQQYCKSNRCHLDSFKIKGYTEVQEGSTSSLLSALSHQPISVAVDAGNWQDYDGGVLSRCGKELDHAVLLTGYVNGQWIIKNSWSRYWGESGYIRLASGNTCGIADAASYPN